MITYNKNHLHLIDTSPDRMQTAWAKPGSTSLQHPPFTQLLWTTHRFSAAARNLLHLFSWQQTPTTSFNTLCDFFQNPKIFTSLLINKQLLMQAAVNKCFMETSITNKLIHHNETLCVLLSICDWCEVKSVYIAIPIFWVRMPCR
jgi:hypothetical protein